MATAKKAFTYCFVLSLVTASTLVAALAQPRPQPADKLTSQISASKQPASNRPASNRSPIPLPSDAEVAHKIIVVPDEPPPDGASDRLVALAACYKNMGSPERAKKSLRLAIKNDKGGKVKKQAQILLDSELPKYTIADEAVFLSNKAFDHYCRREYASAIRVAKECIAKYPKYETPLDTLSVIYLKQHKPQLAREMSKKTLEINPKCSNAWLNLGNSYLMEHDYKKARAAAEKSLQCFPDNMNTKDMIAYLNAKHL